MKKLIFYYLLFFTSVSLSYDGIIIVLQAPLLKSPNDNATILQTARKGTRIYIPPSIDLSQALPEFLPTLDRVGNPAFIRSHHIKLVTNDEHEAQWPISLGNYDTTDYRIDEPISSTFPYIANESRRLSVDLSIGANPLAPYNYRYALSNQNYSYETGVRICTTEKSFFDKKNRYYSGLIGGFSNVANTIGFSNGSNAIESRSLFRIGPYLTYDAFRNSQIRINLGTGITLNYHSTSIQFTDNIGTVETQNFSGFSLSPLLTVGAEYDNFIPGLDLISGSDLFFFFPHSQSSSNSSTTGAALNSTKIQSFTRAQVSFFIGVQKKY